MVLVQFQLFTSKNKIVLTSFYAVKRELTNLILSFFNLLMWLNWLERLIENHAIIGSNPIINILNTKDIA